MHWCWGPCEDSFGLGHMNSHQKKASEHKSEFINKSDTFNQGPSPFGQVAFDVKLSLLIHSHSNIKTQADRLHIPPSPPPSQHISHNSCTPESKPKIGCCCRFVRVLCKKRLTHCKPYLPKSINKITLEPFKVCRFAYINLIHLFVHFQQTLFKCSATFFFFFCTNADSGFWKIIFQSSFWSWFCFNEVITSSGTEEITKRKSMNICCFYTRSVFFPHYPPTREKINASDVCD